MFDLMRDSVWLKAYDLIKEKYGKTLSYRGIKLVSGEKSAADSDAMYYSNGDDLIIPLKSKNHNLGDVIVDRGSLLDPQQKSEVADLVKFLVEPKLYNMQLKQTEESLQKSMGRSLSLVEIEVEDVVDLYSNDNAKRQTLSQIILLKSHTELTRNRVALKLHEMTERNLFVRLDDIIKSVSTLADLASLNDVTVYIEDVEKLDPQTLSLLEGYLSQANPDGPLFLVGSSLTMESILEKNWPESLKRDLAGFYFDIDRVPLAQQASSEILDLLFFQFDNTTMS